MITNQELNKKLLQLSNNELEALIFQFYLTQIKRKQFSPLDKSIESKEHLRFLIAFTKTNQGYLLLHQKISSLKRPTFHSKSHKMVNLIESCKQLNVDPTPNLPRLVKAVSPSLDQRLVDDKFEGVSEKSFLMPHTRAQWDWIERDTKDGKSRTVQLTANRILLHSLVTSRDVKCNWLEDNTILEVWLRYPDLVNSPLTTIMMVTDKYGNPIFNRDSKCLDGFEKDLMSRRDENGQVWERFYFQFEKEQESSFLKVTEDLNGLDIIRGECSDADNQICTYKILQFITREKNPDAERTTAAG